MEYTGGSPDRSVTGNKQPEPKPWEQGLDFSIPNADGMIGFWRRAGRTDAFAMDMNVHLNIELPTDAERLVFPEKLDRRLHQLLDKLDRGDGLTPDEQAEAESLVELADLMSLLRLKAGIPRSP